MNPNAFYVDPYFRTKKSSFVFDLIGLQPIAIGTITQPVGQTKCGIAIGQYAGYWYQGTCAIAIGEYAGHTSQGEDSITIGSEAGKLEQRSNSIAIGTEAGKNHQSEYAIAIGFNAGLDHQNIDAIAIGESAGFQTQYSNAIAIGNQAGSIQQGSYSIAIGYQAGQTNQVANSIVLNASGNPVDASNPGFYVTPIRPGGSGQVLYYNPVTDEILSGAVPSGTIPGGSQHGDYLHWDAILTNWSLGTSQISLGRFAGNTNQAIDGTALGFHAGEYNQSSCAIAIGSYAGSTNQSINAIAIGCEAGQYSQGTNAIAIGQYAGQTSQPANSIILNASGVTMSSTTQASALYIHPIRSGSGSNVLFYDPTTKEVVQGSIAANIIPDGINYSDYLYWDSSDWKVDGNRVHLGTNAGQTNQNSNAIAIGTFAGNYFQGQNAIAIGQYAGQTSQPANSIILNASGVTMSNATQTSALYIDPIRNATSSQALFYNPTSKEITYSDPTFSGSLALQTYTYAYFQARDAVIGKFMYTDCTDKDAFYRLRVSSPSTLYEGSTVYDSSPVYYDDDITANASITGPGSDACMILSVNSSSVTNQYAARQTHYYGHYQPGKSYMALFSFSFGPAVTGVVKRVGFYDVDNSNSNNPLNGILLEQTTSGLSWKLYKGDGTVQIATQGGVIPNDWNVDNLDGSGPSGFNLDSSRAEKNLLGFVDMEWLGVGRVRVGFFLNGIPVIVNVFNNENLFVPYLNNPLLPIRYEVRKTANNSNSGSLTEVCCTILSEGGFDPIGIVRTFQSSQLTISSTNIKYCLAIRLKDGYSRADIKPVSLEIVSDLTGGANVAYFSLYLWRPSSWSIPTGQLGLQLVQLLEVQDHLLSIQIRVNLERPTCMIK
jgi:hypothetical protein